MPQACSVPNCARRHYGHGFCEGHYKRWKKGTLHREKPFQPHAPRAAQCSVESCTRPVRARGWCIAHYNRWLKHGDALLTQPLRPLRLPLLERLMLRIDTSGGPDACWLWRGPLFKSGYGDTSIRGYRRAHVAVWRVLHGPVPPGYELDHLCRNLLCCNDAHIEPVTHTENLRRGIQHQTALAKRHT